MNLFFIVLLGLLMHATRSFSADVDAAPTSVGTALGFGYILLTGFFAGLVFKSIKLPKLTGYIAAGIIVGPSVLALVSERMVQDMQLVNGMAVALIALTAGAELELQAMRPLFRSIKWITLIAVVGTALLLCATVYFMRPMLPFLQVMTRWEALTVALVLGVVMAAQSPAVVVALRDEMRADGVISQTVLGVVVIADLVVIVMFAAASGLAKAALGVQGSVIETVQLLVWELFGSIVIGAGIGLVLAAFLRYAKGRGAPFILMIAFILAEVGTRLHLDPLLLALSAGVLIRNLTSLGERLHHEIESGSLPVYIVFFAVAGATLHLDVLLTVGIPVIAFVLVRGFGLLGGTLLGARVARAPREVTRFAGFGLLPQAGLALALANVLSRAFPEFGTEAGALTVGVVAVNEIVAPALYRFALVKSGEAGRRTDASDELVPEGPLQESEEAVG